ncbi:MAG: response regulator [Nitrospira sp.]|jgi:CheY-like chemotaxis protein|nr:response regulator [Nitrospira sp.]
MGAKILVIEDGADSWQLLSSILRAHQYQPLWAADGVQALSEARKHQPDAILLDLGLPGGDGFLILQRLKSNQLLQAIPVIIVTARDREMAEHKARRYGAAAFLPKPVKADTLIAAIRGVLGQHTGESSPHDSMAWVAMRKNQRIEGSMPIRYSGTMIAGEGTITDLSLSGSRIAGNVPVLAGMVLTLQLFVPGDPEPVLIDRATVQWAKESAFGVDFGALPPKTAARIAQAISTLITMQRDSSRQK